jgi:hypothetical protein
MKQELLCILSWIWAVDVFNSGMTQTIEHLDAWVEKNDEDVGLFLYGAVTTATIMTIHLIFLFSTAQFLSLSSGRFGNIVLSIMGVSGILQTWLVNTCKTSF